MHVYHGTVVQVINFDPHYCSFRCKLYRRWSIKDFFPIRQLFSPLVETYSFDPKCI